MFAKRLICYSVGVFYLKLLVIYSFLIMTGFPQGINMAKIYERVLSTNILREKRRDSFDPQRENLLSEDSICMVNLLGTPRVIHFFFLFYSMIDLVWFFRKRSFVLSREHESQNVATIGTLLDQFMLSCK